MDRVRQENNYRGKTQEQRAFSKFNRTKNEILWQNLMLNRNKTGIESWRKSVFELKSADYDYVNPSVKFGHGIHTKVPIRHALASNACMPTTNQGIQFRFDFISVYISPTRRGSCDSLRSVTKIKGNYQSAVLTYLFKARNFFIHDGVLSESWYRYFSIGRVQYVNIK
jgi:hypothetical protein